MSIILSSEVTILVQLTAGEIGVSKEVALSHILKKGNFTGNVLFSIENDEVTLEIPSETYKKIKSEREYFYGLFNDGLTVMLNESKG